MVVDKKGGCPPDEIRSFFFINVKDAFLLLDHKEVPIFLITPFSWLASEIV